MVCPTCGAPFDGVGSFCRQCGARLVGPPGPPPPGYGYAAPPPGYPPFVQAAPRVQRNLQLLSILWVCIAVLRFTKGLIGMFFLRSWLHNGGGFGRHFPFGNGGPFVSALMPFTLTTTVAMTALSLLVAYGLYQRRPWGRTVAIIMSIFTMVSVFPFGAGLGIFTLWVLAPAASAMEYEAIADRTRPGF
jgi:hypothetical protein